MESRNPLRAGTTVERRLASIRTGPGRYRSTNKELMVQVFVVRVTVPDSVAAMQEDIETGRGFDGLDFFPMSTLEMLSVGSVLDWSLPRHVLVGDIVLFQVSLSALKAVKKIKKELDWDHEFVVEIREAMDLVERFAGSIMAIAKVTAGANRSGGGDWWGSRFYAPITDIHNLYFPIPVNSPSRFAEWPEFSPHGPVQYRQFSSDERYQDFIATLIEEGNDELPDWVSDRPVTYLGDAGAVTKDNWIDVARSAEFGFPTEASLRYVYADWLLRALSDRRVLLDEVVASNDGELVGRVDNVIFIGGVPVPVEVKINASTEDDLFGQLDRYRRADELVTKGRSLAPRDHQVVVVVDQDGLYLTDEGASDLPEPALRRVDTTPQSVASLREFIAEALA
jgi:hypothetical protein